MPAFCRWVVALATTLLLPLPAYADGGCEFIPVAKPVKALADELLFGRLTDGGHITVDIDDKGEVMLDIIPTPKKEKTGKPEAEAAS